VTVFGAGQPYGGKAALLSRLPGMEPISSIYHYQIVKGSRAGVRYEYGVTAGIDDILSLAPDAVVLAAGATPIWPGMLPRLWKDEGFVSDTRDTSAMLLEGFPPQPGTAVLFDADHTAGTYAAAHLLREVFERVVIATPRAGIADDEPLVVRQGIIRRIAYSDIEVIPLVELSGDSELIEGRVDLRNVYSGQTTRISDVVLLTYSTPRAQNDALAAPLRATGMELHIVGDCLQPRTPYFATLEGNAAGRKL
jgi:hypothetical protein